MIESAAPAVEIDRLHTRYGEASVLEDVTLTVRRDETLGLLGLNGQAKPAC